MTEKPTTQPESRRLTREDIAAAINAPADHSGEQRARTLDALRSLADTAATRQAEADKALMTLLSAAESALPEFGVAQAPADSDHQVTVAESEDLYRLLELLQPVVTDAKKAAEAHYLERFVPISVKVAVSSVRWGHVKKTAARMGISRTHLSRLIEKAFPGFLATVAPDNKSKHGYRGVRSPAYAGQSETDTDND